MRNDESPRGRRWPRWPRAGLALAGCGPRAAGAPQEKDGHRGVAAAGAPPSPSRVEYAGADPAAPGDRRFAEGLRAGWPPSAPTSGQKVRRGEVLFTLESSDYDAQARQAHAALESARANLTRTSDSSLSSQVIQAQAAVKQAQVQYDDAKDLYDRTQKLFDGGTASRQQLDGAKAKFDSAGIALDTAKQNLDLIQDKGGPQSTGLASTQVDQAQAIADLAQSQLDNTVITSPITGVVSARTSIPGSSSPARFPRSSSST